MVTKHYPPEFKVDAVALYRSRPEAAIRSVAADLGVNPETLRNWVRTDGRSEPATGPPSRPRRWRRRTQLCVRRSATWRRNARSRGRLPSISAG
ncbi:transposase [Streptomyces shenzhenensis]|uniref:transposase n=1 Tax=Streptomyces shenzhenensis TaxID=943815 RepID=UPI0033F54BB5